MRTQRPAMRNQQRRWKGDRWVYVKAWLVVIALVAAMTTPIWAGKAYVNLCGQGCFKDINPGDMVQP